MIISEYGSRSNIWKPKKTARFMNKGTEYKNHPATFPNELARDHIITWSNIDDLIFDPFCGSGTTIGQCIELNRNFIGSEISSEYCHITKLRLLSYKRTHLFHKIKPILKEVKGG